MESLGSQPPGSPNRVPAHTQHPPDAWGRVRVLTKVKLPSLSVDVPPAHARTPGRGAWARACAPRAL